MILRSWLAFSALGAGILHLALAPGSPLPIAVVLVPLGAAEFCWGLVVLARGEFVLATIARGVALAPILSWAGLLLVGRMLGLPELGASPTVVPMAVATLFDFAIALSLSVYLRVDRTAEPTVPRTNAWGHLAGLFIGGLAVSLLMTPALAFTEAGLNNPHARHAPASTIPDAEFTDHTGH
ncbi:MAG TPA: hypothetical protein VFT01_06080 [Homoserinimonas sp.]|nr:hypothetical protein [Homoserinimonas sp.]